MRRTGIPVGLRALIDGGNPEPRRPWEVHPGAAGLKSGSSLMFKASSRTGAPSCVAASNSCTKARRTRPGLLRSTALVGAALAVMSGDALANGPVAIVRGDFYTPYVFNQLTAAGQQVVEITTYDAASLAQYSAVITYGNTFNNYSALQSYVQGGGTLILTPWQGLNFTVPGNLQVFTNGGGSSYGTTGSIDVLDPSSDLLDGVSFPAAGTFNFGYISGIDFVAGANQIARYTNGTAFLGTASYGAGTIVGLNMHIITSDSSPEVMNTPWMTQLVLNATNFVGGPPPPTCAATTSGDDVCTITASTIINGVSDGLEGTDTIQLGGATSFTFDTSLLTSAFTNFEILQKTGTSTVTLTGVNDFTGDVNIDQGTLITTGGSAINDLSAVTVGAAGTLNIQQSETIAQLKGAGSVTVGAGQSLSINDADGTFSGNVTGAGNVVVTGGHQTFSGTVANTGSLALSGADATLTIAGVRNNSDVGVHINASADGATLNVAEGAAIRGQEVPASVLATRGVLVAAGNATINNLGLIDASGASYNVHVGIEVANTGQGGVVTINNGSESVTGAAAQISGHSTGILHQGSSAEAMIVNNHGAIVGETNNAIRSTAGSLTLNNHAGGYVQTRYNSAIWTSADTSLAVNNAGLIGADGMSAWTPNFGIEAWGQLSLTNAQGGLIQGQYFGIIAQQGLSGWNAGQITAEHAYAISSYGDVTFENRATGVIQSVNNAAIMVQSGSINLVNAGLISGGVGGVYVYGGGQVINSGTISGGGGTALYIRDSGATLINSNLITTQGNTGVNIGADANIANAATGVISGASQGIIAGGGLNLVNAGLIEGRFGAGGAGVVIGAGSGSMIENLSGGIIHGRTGIILNEDVTPSTVLNAGTISGALFGVRSWGHGTSVINSGLITGDASQGVFLYDSGSLANTGTISGGVHAFMGQGLISVLNDTTGVMRGDIYNAVYVGGDNASITNRGHMSGGNAAIYVDGDGLFLSNSGLVQVTGSSQPSVLSGIYNAGNFSTILNSGTIESLIAEGNGIYFNGNGGLIINESGGVISGGADGSAIRLVGEDHMVLLYQGSTVNGDIDASESGGYNTFYLLGTLNGDYVGGEGTNIVALYTGMTLNGALNGGGGANQLYLDGSGAADLDVSTISGFAQRALGSGATWTLSGVDTEAALWELWDGELVVTGGDAIHNASVIYIGEAGTLRVADTEALGGLWGEGSVIIADEQTLIVGAHNGSSTFDGVISGEGGLTHVGEGTLTLGGSNTYTGNTFVSSGTLRLGASDVIADASNLIVADGAVMDMQAFNDTVALAVIAGTLAGTGTLSAAEYQLDGAVVNANLGAGNLFNIGGVSVLNGLSNAALVSVLEGTLRLGASNRLSDLADLSVSADATFDLNGHNETVRGLFGLGDINVGAGSLTFGGIESGFGGRLLGSGSLVHTGGLFTLLNEHTIQTITSTGGELRFLASTSGNVNVSGGTMTGAGTIGGALTISNGATLSPGLADHNDGIGGFQVGSLRMNGGRLALDVIGGAEGTLIDQILVSGIANLSGGLVLPNFQGNIRDFNFSTGYLFLSAGSIVGTFSNGNSFTAASPGLEGLYWRVRYDLVENGAVLELRQLTVFTGADGTSNQNAVGGALGGGQLEASDDWAGVLTLVANLDRDEQLAAFDMISGESIASMTTSLIRANDGFLGVVRQAANGSASDALGTNFASTLGFVGGRSGQSAMIANVLSAFDPSAGGQTVSGGWFSAYAGEASLTGKPGQADVETRLNGYAGGFNASAGRTTIGLAGGVTRMEGDVASRGSSYETDLTHVAAYMRFDTGAWGLGVTGSTYGGRVDTRRDIVIGGAGGTAVGSTDGRGWALSAHAVHRLRFESGLQLSFGVEGTASRVSFDRFTETGAGGLSLEVDAQAREWLTGIASARASQTWRVNGRDFGLYGGLGVMATSGDRQATSDMRFSGAAAGFGNFTVEGAETAPLAGVADFGVETQITARTRISLGYRGVFNDRLDDQQLGVRINVRW